jgi:hypothetical protein
MLAEAPSRSARRGGTARAYRERGQARAVCVNVFVEVDTAPPGFIPGQTVFFQEILFYL